MCLSKIYTNIKRLIFAPMEKGKKVSKTDIIEDLAQKMNAMLADLKEYGRCNVCKYYVNDQCIRGKVCDTREHWEWRGTR